MQRYVRDNTITYTLVATATWETVIPVAPGGTTHRVFSIAILNTSTNAMERRYGTTGGAAPIGSLMSLGETMGVGNRVQLIGDITQLQIRGTAGDVVVVILKEDASS